MQPAGAIWAIGKYCRPLTDSKEPGGQGQRSGAGFLWIREAGIPLLGKSQENDAGWEIFKEFCSPVSPCMRNKRGLRFICPTITCAFARTLRRREAGLSGVAGDRWYIGFEGLDEEGTALPFPAVLPFFAVPAIFSVEISHPRSGSYRFVPRCGGSYPAPFAQQTLRRPSGNAGS